LDDFKTIHISFSGTCQQMRGLQAILEEQLADSQRFNKPFILILILP